MAYAIIEYNNSRNSQYMFLRYTSHVLAYVKGYAEQLCKENILKEEKENTNIVITSDIDTHHMDIKNKIIVEYVKCTMVNGYVEEYLGPTFAVVKF